MNSSAGSTATPGGVMLMVAHVHPHIAAAMLVIHLLCAAMVIGSVTVFDLRLLGLWRQIDVQQLHRVLIPFALLFTLPAAASGALLFSFHSETLIGDGIFVLKMMALFFAAINAMIFATGPWQSVKIWPESSQAPPGARFCALLSMLLLGAIATLGALLASRIAQG